MTILIWALSLIDKDSWLQPQDTLEPRKLRTSHHSSCKASGLSSRKRIPRWWWCPRLLLFKTFSKKKSYGNSTVWGLVVAEYQIRGGKHFFFSETRIRNDLVAEKAHDFQRKYHCNWTLFRGMKPKWFFIILVTYCNHLSSYQPRVSRCFQRNGRSEQFSEIVFQRQKVISIQAPQYRQYAMIGDFLDLAKLSFQEETALVTKWIKDRLEDLKLQNPALATMTGPAVRSPPKKITGDVQFAMDKCEALNSGKQSILYGNPSEIAKGFHPKKSESSTSVFTDYVLSVLYVTPRHPRWKVWHLCGQRRIYCLGTPLEHPFKTNWREGLYCSTILNF